MIWRSCGVRVSSADTSASFWVECSSTPSPSSVRSRKSSISSSLRPEIYCPIFRLAADRKDPHDPWPEAVVVPQVLDALERLDEGFAYHVLARHGVAQRIERNTIKVISDLLINLCETILVSEAGLTHRRNVNNHLHLPPFSCKRFTDIVKGKLQFTAHDLERIQKRMVCVGKANAHIIASIAEKCNFRHASSTSVGFSTVRMA